MLAAGLTPELKDQREGHGGTTSEPETQQSQRRARREAVGAILCLLLLWLLRNSSLILQALMSYVGRQVPGRVRHPHDLWKQRCGP